MQELTFRNLVKLFDELRKTQSIEEIMEMRVVFKSNEIVAVKVNEFTK